MQDPHPLVCVVLQDLKDPHTSAGAAVLLQLAQWVAADQQPLIRPTDMEGALMRNTKLSCLQLHLSWALDRMEALLSPSSYDHIIKMSIGGALGCSGVQGAAGEGLWRGLCGALTHQGVARGSIHLGALIHNVFCPHCWDSQIATCGG